MAGHSLILTVLDFAAAGIVVEGQAPPAQRLSFSMVNNEDGLGEDSTTDGIGGARGPRRRRTTEPPRCLTRMAQVVEPSAEHKNNGRVFVMNGMKAARGLVKSIRRVNTSYHTDTTHSPKEEARRVRRSNSDPGQAEAAMAEYAQEAANSKGRSSMARPGKQQEAHRPTKSKNVSFEDSCSFEPSTANNRSKRVSTRRDNLDVNSLTMGLDLESANFLDWMMQAKCAEWMKSLSRRDPRYCIKNFFDDVARHGVDSIEQDDTFQPELLSPLLSMFQRSSVFSVWRPTSVDSIRKMMTGQGTGKGLDIKGKSAKKGKLSAYVPFLQIHEDKHKTKIRLLPSDGRIRIFYKKREARDNAHEILLEVLKDMTEKVGVARRSLLEIHQESTDGPTQERGSVERVSSCVFPQNNVFRPVPFHALSMKDVNNEEEQKQIVTINEWFMENPSIIVIDDYTPKCYGLDMPKRLFWEGYVMRAKDISRQPESIYDTGRPSQVSFQDMNFFSIKNECEEDNPRAVVWQYTDPYLPPTEPDPDPMMPQTLLMAYEEHGRVMPVVSDFDCFLLGTRGIRFRTPLPEEQVKLVHNMISDIQTILKDCEEGKSKNWTASWVNVMKRYKKHITMPKYGFGDPKSYAIMKHAVHRLEEFGAIRHGAECFNFYFPQELDDEFLVIGGNLGGAKYKYMKLNELQDFLSGCVDLGFTFPLNPKWVLCDKGWKALWDKLIGSTHPNVQLSINAWYPTSSRLRERIEEIHQTYPEGFQSDPSARKKGTQAWDEAEYALDRYQRIQRAKRKLWAVLCWISIVQQSQKRIQAQQQEGNNGGEKEGSEKEKHVSFEDPSLRRLSSTGSLVNVPHHDEIAKMGEMNAPGHVRAKTIGDRPVLSSERSEKFRRSSSSLSVGEDNIEVIDSLLSSDLPLSEYQTAGLQRLREQLGHASSPPYRIKNRYERRHTSIDGHIASLVLEDAPAFILKEYGGIKSDVSVKFSTQVKKIMNAQRFMNAVKLDQSQNENGNDHFLPVEWTAMRKETKQSLFRVLTFAALSKWDYDVTKVAELCNGSPLLFIGWAVMGSPHAQQAMASDLGHDSETTDSGGYNFVTEFNVQMPILCSFLRTVEADYLPNPYHNNTHAADVVQTLNTMLQLGGKDYASSPLDILSILVAAVIHDVKHPGLNNNFQVNSCSELAVQYNDVSVLENYSVTWLFSKLLGQTRDFTVDIFSGLSREQFSKARSLIIRSVLETDMTHHFALLKKMGVHQETLKGKKPEDWLRSYTNEGVNYDPSMDMLCFLLHQSDISNPAKPYPLFVKWAESILTECYSQGDKETSLSLPVSPLCDRVGRDKKQSQIGFIKFVVQPSYQLLGEIIPRFGKTVFPHIQKSLEFWDNYTEDSEEGTEVQE